MAISQAYFNWYRSSLTNVSSGDLLTGDIRLALTSNGYVPDGVAHQFYDAHLTNELTTANGYTSGGQALANRDITAVNSTTLKFVSDSVIWVAAGAGLTAHIGVLYNNTPASSKPLIGWFYLNYNGGIPTPVSVVAGFNLVISPPAAGWFSKVVANAQTS